MNIDQGAEVDNKRLAHALAVSRSLEGIRDDRRAAGSPSRIHIGEALRAKKTLIGLKKRREVSLADCNEALSQLVQNPLPERGAASPPYPTNIKRNRTAAKPDISI